MEETKEYGDDYKWYVVRAITGKELAVKKYIETELERAKLLKFVPQILIPMEKVYKIVKGKKVAKDKSFYPGYILIHAKLVGEVMPTIKSVSGVVNFLGIKGEPSPIRMTEVNRILGRADESAGVTADDTEPIIVGEHVKVIDGPFKDFNGVVEEVNHEKRKVKVMVLIFGRKTPLELTYNQIDKE